MGYGIKWINMDKPSTNCRIWPQILRRQGATYEGVQWAQSTEPNTAARHFFITMAGIIWPSTGKRNSGVMSFNVNFIHFIHFIHPTYPLYYYLCPLMNWGSQIPIRTSLMGWPSSSCFWKRSCSRTWSHMSLGEIFPSANMGQTWDNLDNSWLATFGFSWFVYREYCLALPQHADWPWKERHRSVCPVNMRLLLANDSQFWGWHANLIYKLNIELMKDFAYENPPKKHDTFRVT